MKTQSEVVIQADLGGMTIAFTGKADADEAALNAQLDLYAKVLGRQRAKITLTEKLVDLLGAQKALKSQPEREREMLRSRAAERARQYAAMEAAHNATGRRAEFQPNPAQRNQLATLDSETAAEREKFSNERQGLELSIPIIEAQISRLRAVIAGRDPIEPLESESAKLAERAAAD